MLEKIVSRLLFPVPVICEVLILGLVLLWLTRRQKAGKILVTLGAVLLLLLGNSRVSGFLLSSLEQRYHPLALSSLPAAMESMKETYVVVLGSGYSPDPRVDLDSHLSQDGLVRLVEGVRICRQMPGCKLILSGGPPAAARTMNQIALSLDVRQQDIILEPNSRNTEQEARFIQPTVGATPFLLVTSASHMPRAMGLFRKLGMQPTAVPTDYLAKQGGALVPDDIYPGDDGLYQAERTVYEYLGMTWEKLLGQI